MLPQFTCLATLLAVTEPVLSVLGPLFGSSQRLFLKVDGQGQAAGWGCLDCCSMSGSSELMLGVLLLAQSPFPCFISLSASLEQQWLPALSGHQAAAYKFSGHLLLNCVPIESNTITL